MRYTFLIMTLTLVLGGCASNQLSTVSFHTTSLSASEQHTLSKLTSAYKDWQGTPYRFGGNSRTGIDCSAFTQQIYRSVYDRNLPRTTASQHSLGSTIKIQQLKPGDLVFFKPEGKGRHVGIYLSNGRFMHASTSVGVTISSLTNPWWQAAYWKSIRP